MSDFTIKVDDRVAQAALSRLLAFGLDMSPAMADIAEGMMQHTEDRFDRQQSPDGQPWAALSPAYAQLKQRKQPGLGILVLTGRLSGELRSEFGTDFAEVATAGLPYVALHQFGGLPGMAPGPAAVPARPFAGFGPEDQELVEDVVGDHLRRLTEQRGSGV